MIYQAGKPFRRQGGPWACAVLISVALSAMPAGAMVDMKSANYSETWYDLTVAVGSDQLRVSRSYNSRSLYNGLFGFGWCSDWETHIQVSGSGQLRVTECGGGQEVIYFPEKFDVQAEVTSQIELILTAVRKRRPDLNEKYLKGLRSELWVNEFMRDEFLRRLGVSPYPLLSTTYVASDRRSSLIFDGRQFTRIQSDGRKQIFDERGRLTRQRTEAGKWIFIRYKHGRPVRLTHEEGAFLDISYDENTGKISKIESSAGDVVNYVTKGTDLQEVFVPGEGNYRYEYDEMHNLTRVFLPDNTFNELTYNLDKDWVTSYRNRKGCLETYKYIQSKINPRNHFWSDVVKTCEGKITNKSKYEFFHEVSDSGYVYLKAINTVINGVSSRLDYDLQGRAIRREQQGVVTHYKYDPSGRLVWVGRANQSEELSYEEQCTGPASLKRVVNSDSNKLRAWRARMRYSSSCQIAELDRSDGVHLSFSNLASGKVKVVDEGGYSVILHYSYSIARPERIEAIGAPPWAVVYTDQNEIDMAELVRSGNGPMKDIVEKIIDSLPQGL